MLKLTRQSVRARGSLLQILTFAAGTAYIYFTSKDIPVPSQCADYAGQQAAAQASNTTKLWIFLGLSFAVMGANLVISAMISAWQKTKQLQELQNQQEEK
jgi:D-alanyl-lipoteichoic acid acyltransferase DltB (MBOAT superfamily)